MPTRNVNLTEHLACFIDQQVHSGSYQNASEVVREALRRFEADLGAERGHTEAVRAIRAAVEQGRFAPSHQQEVTATLRRLAGVQSPARRRARRPAAPGGRTE